MQNLQMGVADQKFYRNYVDSNVIEVESGCYEWQRVRARDGYGIAWINRLPLEHRKFFTDIGIKYTTAAHRVSYLAYGNVIEKERPFVMHLCNNRKCCNPRHLVNGTHQENMWHRQMTTVRTPPHRLTPAEKQILYTRLRAGHSMYSISKDMVMDLSCVMWHRNRLLPT